MKFSELLIEKNIKADNKAISDFLPELDMSLMSSGEIEDFAINFPIFFVTAINNVTDELLLSRAVSSLQLIPSSMTTALVPLFDKLKHSYASVRFALLTAMLSHRQSAEVRIILTYLSEKDVNMDVRQLANELLRKPL